MKKIQLIAIGMMIFLMPIFVSAQIERVEPLNWWVGMKKPLLQLMVYGKDIAETDPTIGYYKGVKTKLVTRGDSKNYLFIDFLISPTAKAGTLNIDFKKNGKILYSLPYPLLEKAVKSESVEGFNASDVIYLVTPDRFANGDEQNDVNPNMREKNMNRNFEGGRHGGDIRGIINHLDYIADMGFTAIWPTPMLENDMSSYSYHGYAITDHYKVDPRFGTLDDYKELASKAKQKGIKLIFDSVINHTGRNYWWMKDLPFKDWINYPDSMYNTHHRRTVNQDLYASQYDKDRMTKGWFAPTMPDLNGGNYYLANYLIQNSLWWIETLQLGGIRQDTYCYSDKEFSRNWSRSIMKEYPNFSIVGEEWSYNPLITSYWQMGKKNHDGYESYLTNLMDFPLQTALIQSLKEPESSDFSKGLTRLYEALANDFVYQNPNNLMIFGDNHDMDRLFTQLHEDPKLARIALTYLLTIRGIPQLYYGTEILLENTQHSNDHGFIRKDMPGGWKGDEVDAFSQKGLNPEQMEFQSWLKQLLNWRKNNSVVHTGKILHFAPFDGVYVYFRYKESKMIMVAISMNNAAVNLNCSRFSEILKEKKTAKEIFGKSSFDLKKGIVIEPKSAVIFEIE